MLNHRGENGTQGRRTARTDVLGGSTGRTERLAESVTEQVLEQFAEPAPASGPAPARGSARGAATEVPTGGGPATAEASEPASVPLAAGRIVGKHYRIDHYTGEGTFGRVYVARDVRDGKSVVVKALRRDAPSARWVGDEELKALRDDLGHPQIVIVIEWVEPAPDDRSSALYLVLEHLPGAGLDEEIDRAFDVRSGHVAHRDIPRLLRRVRGVLDGVAKVHRRSHAINDFKPAHIRAVDHGRDDGPVKLIDFGAVAPFGPQLGRTLFHSPGYSDPRLGRDGPSAASDVYTIGRTIMVVATGADPGAEPGIPDATIFDRCPSLHRLIRRATAPDPDHRFRSVEELAAALDVVIARLVAVLEPRLDSQRSLSSAHFTWSGHGGVARPTLERLVPGIEATVDTVTADEVLQLLPVPEDAALSDPGERAEAQNVGLRSRAVRGHLDRGDLTEARREIELLSAADPRGWRATWFTGVLALREERLPDARTAFDRVADVLPGDLAPELALAACQELLGEHENAGRGYDQVWRADGRRTAAAFGAARAYARGGAVEEAARVLTETSLPEARTGAARVLLFRAVADGLSAQRFRRADAVLTGGPDGVSVERRVEFLLIAWAWVEARGGVGDEGPDGVDFLGVRLEEGAVRDALSASLRDLARRANGARSAELVDLANSVRRPTWW